MPCLRRKAVSKKTKTSCSRDTGITSTATVGGCWNTSARTERVLEDGQRGKHLIDGLHNERRTVKRRGRNAIERSLPSSREFAVKLTCRMRGKYGFERGWRRCSVSIKQCDVTA